MNNKQYIEKLRTDVLIFIKTLYFDEKFECINRLESILMSALYSAPENHNYWIGQYINTLNVYLLYIPQKNELKKLLKV